MLRQRKTHVVSILVIVAVCGLLWAASVTEEQGTHAALTVTNLHSLASSATAGWKSAVVDNRTTDALDYEVCVSLDMANTSPANDQAVYVYLAPGYHDGSNWIFNDSGTATAPDGTEGTYTIGSGGGNLVLAAVLKYTAADQVVKKTFKVRPALGYNVGDGFCIVIVNYTGAATAASGNVVHVKPLTGDVS